MKPCCGECRYFCRLTSVRTAEDLDGGMCNLHGHNVDEITSCDDFLGHEEEA